MFVFTLLNSDSGDAGQVFITNIWEVLWELSVYVNFLSNTRELNLKYIHEENSKNISKQLENY